MANKKLQRAKLLKTLGTSLVAGILLAGCAKDLPEKKPDNFDRDVHSVSKFSSGAIVETTGSGTLALEGENEVERGVLALNDGQMYGVKFLSGDSTLSKLFEGLKVRASRPGERFKFNFKMTEDKLIAYMETEGHLLSEMQEALTTSLNGKKQIPVFSYSISYGNIEKRKNDLEEETRYVEFKGAEVSNATAIKFTGTKDTRSLSALRGHADKKKVYSKSKIAKKIWSGTEISKFFQVKAQDSKAFSIKAFRTKVVDDKMYFQLPLSKASLQDEPKALDLLKSGQDPRISVCDAEIKAKIDAPADCILFPVFEVGVTNVSPKYNLDTKTQIELDTISFENVVAKRAKFIKTDINSYLTEFNYNKDKDQFSKSSLKSSVYSKEEAKEILAKLKISPASLEAMSSTHAVKLTSTEVIGTNIVDGQVYVQLPVKKSDLSALENSIADVKNNPQYSECSQLAKDAISAQGSDCVMKPVYNRSISYKLHKITFNPDSDLPTIEEKAGTRTNSSFITVDLDSEQTVAELKSVNGLKIEDTLSIDALNKDYTSAEQVNNIIKMMNIRDYKAPKAAKTKTINDYLWFLEAVKKSSLSKLEVAIAEREIATGKRYEVCSKEVAKAAGLKVKDCILKPTLSRKVTYKKVNFTSVSGKDSATIELDSAERSDALFMHISKDGYASRFEFDDYTSIVKNEVLIDLKKDIDTKKDFLYVPMSLGTPRDVAIADPFFQGEEKIVKFRLIEAGIEVYEPEKYDEFSENTLNAKPVLIIPGRYVDFKCSEDDRGNCTGSLSYDSDKNWDKKRFFIPNFEGLQVLEKNTLDLWGLAGNNCVYPVDTAMPKEHGYVLEPKKTLNLHLRRTYKTANNMSCLNQLYTELSGLSPMSFKADFYYSIVALDSITTKGYEKVVYPYSDHSTFGFFKGDETKMDHGHDRQRTTQEYRLHRWNPKLKKLVYYKSETFNLRKNKGRKSCSDYSKKTIANYDTVDFYNEIKCALNKSTAEAVKGINGSLKRANANFELDLREPKKGVNPGDLRYNTLVLIDDPLDNGLLGYAPTVANPRTGEIVQGHVNMYSGVLVSMSRRVYQGMYRLMINEKKVAGTHTIAAPVVPAVEGEEEGKSANASLRMAPSMEKLAEARNRLHKKLGRLNPNRNELPVNTELKEQMQELKQKLQANDPQLIKLAKKNKTFVEDRINRWAKNSAYPADGYLISDNLGKQVFQEVKDNKELFDHNGMLKHWDKLTMRQQKTVTVAMIAHTYTTTLVHEFGHNLGLRHNFRGSFDKENFYKPDENGHMPHGIENSPRYSSIMDYGFSELNELPVFGSYDVAALRFAYAREVELKDGTFVKLEDKEKDQPSLRERGLDLKDYEFCTDGNVGTTPKCHRFDEGTSLTEIAQHFRNKFENSYYQSNFRDGRKSFNYYSVAYYTSYVNYALKRSRDMFEEYESVADMFDKYFKRDKLENWDILAQGCTGIAKEELPEWFCTNVNDAIEATKIVGEMLLSIVKTPDAQCLLQDGEGRPLMLNLREVYDYIWQHYQQNEASSSCFDPAITKWLSGIGYTLVGERGKYVQRLSESNQNFARYVSDLSVRGIWPAKLMAMRNLTTRLSGISSTEKGHQSYVEHKDIGPQIVKLIEELATGQEISNGEQFVDINGVPLAKELQFGYKLDYGEGSYIPEQAHPYVIYNFGLPFFEGTQINKQVLKQAALANYTVEESQTDSAKKFIRHFTVRKYSMGQARNSDGFVEELIDEVIYAATENNVIANELLDAYKTAGALDKYDANVLAKVIAQRENPALPTDFTEAQVSVTKIPAAMLQQLLMLASQGYVLNEGDIAYLKEQFGEEIGNHIVKGFALGFEGMSEVIKIVEGLKNTPPADATDEEKEIYKYTLEAIQDYLSNGSANKKAIETQLKNLPQIQ